MLGEHWRDQSKNSSRSNCSLFCGLLCCEIVVLLGVLSQKQLIIQQQLVPNTLYSSRLVVVVNTVQRIAAHSLRLRILQMQLLLLALDLLLLARQLNSVDSPLVIIDVPGTVVLLLVDSSSLASSSSRLVVARSSSQYSSTTTVQQLVVLEQQLYACLLNQAEDQLQWGSRYFIFHD